MNAVTRLSTKGQVVIPSDVRQDMCWAPGTELEVIKRPGGVFLRAARQATDADFQTALTRLRSTVDYHGPYVPDVKWTPAIGAMLRRDWGDQS